MNNQILDLKHDFSLVDFTDRFDVSVTWMTGDLFHSGHMNILTKMLEVTRGNVVVYVSTDEMNKTKNKSVFLSFKYRADIISKFNPRIIVMPEESLDDKPYHMKYLADRFKPNSVAAFIGEDWPEKYYKDLISNKLLNHGNSRIIRLERYPGYSSTELKSVIMDNIKLTYISK